MDMEFDQAVRQQWRAIRARIALWRTHAGLSAGRAADAGRDALEHPRAGLLARIALIAALVLFVLYPVLALLRSTIDDNPDFAARNLKPGASHAVANAAALINREVNKHGWTPSAPWFSPNALLDNMPNYQRGIVAALSRFALEMSDQIGRPRGASDSDSNLQAAAGLLQYPPDKWVWNPSASLWPSATSQSQYRDASKDLREYNRQLAAGQATFDRSAITLRETLAGFVADLGSSSAAVQDHLERSAGWPFDTSSDDVFYMAKGHMYADYILLKGLQADFASVLAQREIARPWAAMMESLRSAIALEPWIVLNGAPDSDFFPCTLCGEGFYLLRAREQLREIEDILQQ
jgi:hypothetical protein